MTMVDAAAARARNMLRLRALNVARHVQRLFKPGGTLSRDAEIVLADLREFTFARASTFSSDPYIAARNAGRRDVFLRLQNYLQLDEDEVSSWMEVDDGI